VESKRLQTGSNTGCGETQPLSNEAEGIMLKVHAKKLNAVEILSLEGQITNGDTETLRSAVELVSDTSVIILDLSNVTRLDAHGLGVLLQLREQSLANGVNFKLMNVNEPLSTVFNITRLNTVFEINSSFEMVPQATYAPRMLVAA
jgi:anti-sigma B factor antagonist